MRSLLVRHCRIVTSIIRLFPKNIRQIPISFETLIMNIAYRPMTLRCLPFQPSTLQCRRHVEEAVMEASAPPPPRGHKDPPNQGGREGGRVKTTFSVHEVWTSTTCFFQWENTPRPSKRSRLRCSHPPAQNPAFGPTLVSYSRETRSSS